jgi:DNA-directed RNA polymerase sigma subunit (sigma70/sigma32)
MQDSRVLTLDGLLASTSIVGTEVVRAYLQAQDLLQAWTIRLLRHVRDRAGRLLRARTELGFELGRDPGAAKLARYLDCETAEVAEVLSRQRPTVSVAR